MTLAIDDGIKYGNTLTTTDETPVDVAGLTLTIPDKSIVSVELEARAVRHDTPNPLAYRTRRTYTFRRSGGVSSLVGTTQIFEHGDAAMEAAVAVVGGGATIKTTVTGLASTTFDWVVSITVGTVTSS